MHIKRTVKPGYPFYNFMILMLYSWHSSESFKVLHLVTLGWTSEFRRDENVLHRTRFSSWSWKFRVELEIHVERIQH